MRVAPTPIKTSFVRIVAAVGMAMGRTMAEEPQDIRAWDEQALNRAWLEPYDATLLSRRLLTQFEFEDYEGGDERGKLFWKLRWAIPLLPDVALGFQFEAPLAWAHTDGDDDLGWGDMEARAGVVFRVNERFRAAIAVNGKFPTASSNLLGDDRLELKPLVALRWQAAARLEIGANLEYNFTPRDEGDDRVSATELKVPIAFKLSDDWSCFTSYEPLWNDVSGAWRHRLDVGVSRVFGPRREYALTIAAELPLKDESFEWKGIIGLSYYFK